MTDATSTLSVEIKTSDAETKLQGLATSYAQLKAAFAAELGDDGVVKVNAEVATLNKKLKETQAQLSTALAEFEVFKNGVSSGAKSLSTSMGALGGAVSSSLKLDEGAAKLLNERLKRVGIEAQKNLTEGLTKSSIGHTYNLLSGLEENTVKSLNRVKVLVKKAQYEMALAPEATQLKYGPELLAPGLLQNIESRLKALNDSGAVQKLRKASATARDAEAQAIIDGWKDSDATAKMETAAAKSLADLNKKLKKRALDHFAAVARVNENINAKIRAASEAAAKAEAQAIIDGWKDSDATAKMETAAAKSAAKAREALEKRDAAVLAAVKKSNDEAAAKLRAESAAAAKAEADALQRSANLSVRYQSGSATQQAAANLRAGYALATPNADLSGHAQEALEAARAAGGVRELIKAKEALNPVVKEAASSQKLWNQAGSEAHAVVRGLSGSLGQLWLTYGQIAPLLAGAALGAAFKGALDKGAEFEFQLQFVKSLSGASAAAVGDLSKAAIDLGTTGMKGPVELANGLRILAQAGLKAEEALLALPHASNLAVVGEMTLEQASVTLAGVLEAFKLDFGDISHVGDVFAKAAALSQTSVQGMTEAMKTASVVGSQYGVSMEDTATALTLLAKVNIHGTSAGTALRNMLKELYAPTAQAAAVLKDLGVSASDASTGQLRSMADIIFDLQGKLSQFDRISQTNILQKIFGERGAKEAIAMLSLTREEWNKLRSDIATSEGFMAKVAADLNETTKGLYEQIKNTLEADLIGAFNKTDGAAHELALTLRNILASDAAKVAIEGLVTAMTSLAAAVLALTPLLVGLGTAWGVFALVPIANAALVSLGATISGLIAPVGTFLGMWAMTGFSAAAGSALLLEGAVAGLGAAVAALATPLGIVVVAMASFYAWSEAINSLTPEAIRNADGFTSAIDRQSKALDGEIERLKQRQRLLATGSELDKDAIASERHRLLAARQSAETDLAKGSGSAWISEKNIREANEALAKLDKAEADLKDKINTRNRESAKTYLAEQMDALKQLEVRATATGKSLNAANLKEFKQIVEQIRNTTAAEPLAILKERLKAVKTELSQDINLPAGTRKADTLGSMAEKQGGKGVRKDAELSTELATYKQIAQVQKSQLDAEIALLESRKALGELSEYDLNKQVAKLQVQKAIADAAAAYAEMEKISQSDASKFGGKDAAAQEANRQAAFNKASTEFQTAMNKRVEVQFNADKKVADSHEKTMQQLAKDSAKLMGEEGSYADQYAAEWQNAYGKRYAAVVATLDKAYELSAKEQAALLAEMNAMDEYKEKLITIGKLKDLIKPAETTLTNVKTQFAEIDQKYGSGIFGGLVRDAEKAELLKSKLAQLQTVMEELKKSDTPFAQEQAARLRKEIQALYSDSHKGLDALLKDIEGGLTSALQAGFASGGFSSKSFIDNLKAQLKAASLKITISAIVDPVMGGVKGMLSSAMGGGGGGGGGVGGLLNMSSTGNSLYEASQGGGMYGAFATSSVGQALGLSTSTTALSSVPLAAPTYALEGLSALSAGSAEMSVAAASMTEATGALVATEAATTTALTTLGAAMPYVAAALVIANAIGAFGKRGGPQQGQYGEVGPGGYKSSFTMSGGDALGNQKLNESIYAQVSALYAAANKKASDLTIQQGYKLDPQGSAAGVAYRNIIVGGRTLTGGTFDGNNGAQWTGANNDATGAANFLGKLGTADFLALLKELNDPKLSAAADALMKNFGELENSLPKYLTAQEMQKQMSRSLMTAEEKTKDTGEALTKMFESLGMAVPESAEMFEGFINNLDLTTEKGQQALATFNSMGPAFLEWEAATRAAREALKQQMDDIEYQLKTMSMTPLEKSLFDIARATNDAVDKAKKLSASEADLSKIRELGTKQAEAAAEAARKAAAAAQMQAYGSARSAYANLVGSSVDERSGLVSHQGAAQESLSDKVKALADHFNITTDAVQKYIDSHGGVVTAVADFWKEVEAGVKDADEKLKITGLLDGLINATDGVNKAGKAITDFDKAAAEEQVKAAKEAADKLSQMLDTQYSLQLEIAKLNKDDAAIALATANQRSVALKKLDGSLQGLQSELWKLQDAADAAAKRLQTYNEYMSAGQALNSAMQAIREKADSSQLAADTARNAITDGYIAAQQRVNDLLKQSSEEMRGFAKNIREFITNLAMTTGTSAQNYAAMQADFTITAAAARAGDKTALGSITEKAKTLLEAGKGQVATATDYALLVSSVRTTLADVATLSEGRAGPLGEAVDPLITAQEDLIKWQHAVAVSGAKTERELTDYASDWRKAQETNVKAQADLVTATQMLANSNITQQAIDNTMISTLQALAEAIKTFSTARAAAVASGGVSAAVASGAMTAAGPTSAPTVAPTVAPTATTTVASAFQVTGNRALDLATGAVQPDVYWDAKTQSIVMRNAYADGINLLPSDQIAQVHKGERIVPAADNRELIQRLSRPAPGSQDVVNEIKALRESNEMLRAEVRAVVRYTGDTSRNLERVIPDGDAIQTRVLP